MTRLKSGQDLIGSVRGIQQFAAVRAGIAKGQFFNSEDARDNDVSLDLLVHGSKDPRYSCYSIDRDPPHQIPYAVFIVPQGRYARVRRHKRQNYDLTSFFKCLAFNLCKKK